MKRQRLRRDECEYRRLDDYRDSDSGEDVELFPKKTYVEPPTVEKVVEEGDTLQSLAIRYGCSVTELKRLNHILNDNEIYAKGVVKVPDRPFSTILAGVHSSGRSSPNAEADKLLNLESLHESLHQPSVSNKNFNEVIFNSTLISKDSVNQHTEEIQVDDEEVTLLPKSHESTPEVVSKFSCNGADAGLSWVSLVVLLVLLIIGVPMLFGFYIYKHPEQLHHHGNIHNHNVSHTEAHTH